MNNRKFKRAQARKEPSIARGFRVPRETAMALWLWACNVNAMPREFEQLLTGQDAHFTQEQIDWLQSQGFELPIIENFKFWGERPYSRSFQRDLAFNRIDTAEP
jgi:hypothetical protein